MADVTDLEEFKSNKQAAPYETRTNQIHALADRVEAMLPRDWAAKDRALVLARAWMMAIGNYNVRAAMNLQSQMMLLLPDETPEE